MTGPDADRSDRWANGMLTWLLSLELHSQFNISAMKGTGRRSERRLEHLWSPIS